MFVRQGFPLAEHNYMLTRRFVGAQVAGRSGVPVMLLHDDEPGAISPFAAAKFGDPVEREGELIRRDIAPNVCSRLGGVFAFGDVDTCLRASTLYGWDLGTVRLGRAHGSWRAYDMQIVSLLQRPDLPELTRRALWHHYWSGQPGQSFDRWEQLMTGSPAYSDPVWERLIDGYVQFEQEDRSPIVGS